MDALDFDFGVFEEDFEDLETLYIGHNSEVAVSSLSRQALLSRGEDEGEDCSTQQCSRELQRCETNARKRRKREEQNQIMQLQMQYKLPRPRILKGDFRRNFPIMWVNVFNSCDYQQMMVHLNTYYERDVTVQQRDLRPADIRCLDSRPMTTGTASGLPFLGEFWYKAMNVAPDLVCTLKHTFLKVRSDGTSVIMCSFALNGTKLLSLDNHDPASLQKFANFRLAAAENESNGKIGATAAAVAAVAPTKLASVLRTDRAMNAPLNAAMSAAQKGNLPAAVCINISDSTDEEIVSDAISLTSRSGDSLSEYISSQSASQDANTSASASIACHSTDSTSLAAADEECSSPGQLDAASEQDLSSRFEELSDLDSLSDGSTALQQSKNAPGRPKGSATGNTKGLTGALKRKLQKAQQLKQKATEWMSVGQAAYRNGSMEDRTSQDLGQGQVRAVSHSQARSSGAKLSATAKSGAKQDAAPAAQEAQQHQDQQQLVLTASLDCICSFEMEFNSDSRVVSMVLNYIT